MMTYLPLYLQNVFALSTAVAGLGMLPFALAAVLLPTDRRLSVESHIGPRSSRPRPWDCGRRQSGDSRHGRPLISLIGSLRLAC